MVVSVQNVKKHFDKRVVVNGISLEADEGDLVLAELPLGVEELVGELEPLGVVLA